MNHLYIVELLGTLLLVMMDILSGANGVIVGATLGLLLLASSRMQMMNMYNPAASIANLYRGVITKQQFIMYLAAQIVGALFAVHAVKFLR